MDSVMLGSLTFYRRLMHDNIFSPATSLRPEERESLPTLGHALAGVMAGSTVSCKILGSPTWCNDFLPQILQY